jgi:hypothetical protein
VKTTTMRKWVLIRIKKVRGKPARTLLSPLNSKKLKNTRVKAVMITLKSMDSSNVTITHSILSRTTLCSKSLLCL